MIRNIVFDMGNVLLRFDPNELMIREKITDSDDQILIRNQLFRSVEWAMMDLGILSEETAEPSIMQRIPERLRAQARKLLYHWADESLMTDGIIETLQALKRNGYQLYLLSNASVAQPEYWSALPVSRWFEGTLISAQIGVVKPMDEIYACFIRKFSLKPEECLFIDDLPINVACAVKNGWQGIVFHGDIRMLENEMRKDGIRI